MKKAGVDFIATCIDLNGMKTLASELHRQDMDDVVLLPPEHLRPDLRRRGRRPVRGRRTSACSSGRSRPTAEGTGLEQFMTWMDEAGQTSPPSWRWSAGSTPRPPTTACSPPGRTSTRSRSPTRPTRSPTSRPTASSSRSTGRRRTRPTPRPTRDVEDRELRRRSSTWRTASSCRGARTEKPWLCWAGRQARRRRAEPDQLRVGHARSVILAASFGGDLLRGAAPGPAAGHGLRPHRDRVRPGLQDVRACSTWRSVPRRTCRRPCTSRPATSGAGRTSWAFVAGGAHRARRRSG